MNIIKLQITTLILVLKLSYSNRNSQSIFAFNNSFYNSPAFTQTKFI